MLVCRYAFEAAHTAAGQKATFPACETQQLLRKDRQLYKPAYRSKMSDAAAGLQNLSDVSKSTVPRWTALQACM
jgi:hypothetical protein